MVTFDGLLDGREHLGIVFGDVSNGRIPVVRIHSECLTGDLFGSARCDCGLQLSECMWVLSKEGGIMLYLRQEGRGIGLYNKLDAYRLQDCGLDTFEANRALNFQDDQRSYAVAVQMLGALGVSQVHLISNNPDKVRQLRSHGISVDCQRLTATHVTAANRRYLEAKVLHAGHSMTIK